MAERTWHWRTEEAVRSAASEIAETMRAVRRSLQDGKLETWAKNGELGLSLVEAFGERDAMQRRAEAAESDWQAAERRVVLLEAVVKEARGHIRNLLDGGFGVGAELWLKELDDRLSAEVAPTSVGGTDT